MTGCLYQRCDALFAAYPLAVDGTGRPGWMTLLLPGGDDSQQFAELVRTVDGDPPYAALPWYDGEAVAIEDLLERGIPIPRDGALLGYAVGEKITALMPFWVSYRDPGEPVPSYTVLPRAGEHHDLWPLFIGKAVRGWLWDLCRQGRVVGLGPSIAASHGAVFWACLDETLSIGCCVVTRDLTISDVTLLTGVYVPYTALQDGVPVPSLRELLARAHDLAPEFQPEAGAA